MKGMGGKQLVGDEWKFISFVAFTSKRLHCWQRTNIRRRQGDMKSLRSPAAMPSCPNH